MHPIHTSHISGILCHVVANMFSSLPAVRNISQIFWGFSRVCHLDFFPTIFHLENFVIKIFITLAFTKASRWYSHWTSKDVIYDFKLLYSGFELRLFQFFINICHNMFSSNEVGSVTFVSDRTPSHTAVSLSVPST